MIAAIHVVEAMTLVGSILTFGAIIAGVTAYLVNLRRGGDPSDLRNAYMVELDRRKESDIDRDRLTTELLAAKSRTDISGLEERVTRRMDAFERQAEKQTAVLTGLLEAVNALVEKLAHEEPKGWH